MDFPLLPSPPRLGTAEYQRDYDTRITQTVERNGDTLRFTQKTARSAISVMEWKRGAPFWSTLTRTKEGYSAKSRAYEPIPQGSGKLLEK